jgi:tRNA (mo5U34)-methyltransferase
LDLEKILAHKNGYREWKNIKPMVELMDAIGEVETDFVLLDDVVTVGRRDDIDDATYDRIYKAAKRITPWRKGPFNIFGVEIDTEWRSYKKYNLLKPYFNLEDKVVGDIGCNNGYYMFRMLKDKPKRLIGFDPMPLMKIQFDFVNKFLKSDIEYELLGVEHLPYYGVKFDTLFCLGVLYHRSDPVGTLKSLASSLNSGGELFLDTFMIDGDDEVALTPQGRYSKIPNIYFIPTINALKNWLYRAKFKEVEVLAVVKTEVDEQRQTEWINTQSLNNFLDKDNPNKTVEGYPAPKRVYIKATI